MNKDYIDNISESIINQLDSYIMSQDSLYDHGIPVYGKHIENMKEIVSDIIITALNNYSND